MMIIVYLALLPAAILTVVGTWIIVGSLLGAFIGNAIVWVRGIYRRARNRAAIAARLSRLID